MPAPPADAQRRPTFASDIAPIMLTHCATCHRPADRSPFPLLSFADVTAKAAEIVKVTEARTMPPWLATQGKGFPELLDDRRLTDRQITAIKNWVNRGMPTGDLRKLPVPPSVPVSWTLGVPDMIIGLPRTIGLTADGDDEWRNIVVPVGYPTDFWVSAIDYQPGSSNVLKHARFFVAPPDLVVTDNDPLPGVGGLIGTGSLENYGDRVLAAGRTLVELGEWTPGSVRRFLPAGLSIRIPARANIVIQMHLRPGGVDAIEDGKLGIYLSKVTERRAMVGIELPPASGIAAGLSIPAGDAAFWLRDSFTLPIDVEAVGARAHAHNLGRNMTLTAIPEKGPSRGLLHIAQWNNDWPESYFFQTPIRLPAGTALTSEIVYDNSAGNPKNLFSPPRRMGWGRIPVGEMGSLTLLIAAPADADAKTLADALDKHLRDQLLGRR